MFRLKMLAIILTVVAGVAVLTACSGGNQTTAATASSGPTSGSNTAFKASWVKPQIGESTINISVDEVQRNGIENFLVNSPAGNLSFMAYQLDGTLYVRADICPPCLSESFTLKKGQLICDSCGTVFDAKTGKGVNGACVRFPKAAVPYEVIDGNIMMKGPDLMTAFQDTLTPG